MRIQESQEADVEGLLKAEERLGSHAVDQSQSDSIVVPPEEDNTWWFRKLYQDVEFEDDVRGGNTDK